MKKHLKLLVLFISFGIVFSTYKLFLKEKEKITYIALGDSVAEGMNSYLQVDYGYTDYIKDYLNRNDRLSFYTKAFAKAGKCGILPGETERPGFPAREGKHA